MISLVVGLFFWSYEVGAKMSASVYCIIFHVDGEHMYNYPKVLMAKLPVLFLMLGFAVLIPKNE